VLLSSRADESPPSITVDVNHHGVADGGGGGGGGDADSPAAAHGTSNPLVSPVGKPAGVSTPRVSMRRGDTRDTVDVSDMDSPMTLRRCLAFIGIGISVAVGQADPGNWSANLAAGSQFGYRLVWVLFLSNCMAVLLQIMAGRLGIVTRRDLAAMSHDVYPRRVCVVLWLLAEIAIMATDIAEVIGSAIALKLLFHLPLVWGVLLTGLDTLVFLMLQRFGVRSLEAFIAALFFVIFVCFVVELAVARPPFGEVMGGFLPYIPARAVYLATSVLGATLMPHSLFLQSGMVLSRHVGSDPRAKRRLCRTSLWDTVISLNLAFFVNLSILLVAATAFYGTREVATLQEAHALLNASLGSRVAPVAFAIALLAAGSSSTVTATMAGQIVMEGFVRLRMRPWLRRLVSRLCAIVPAVITVAVAGEAAANDLLVLSQVILSLQLPFTIVPLLKFTGAENIMGAEFVTRGATLVITWIVAAIVLALNIWLVVDSIIGAHWLVATTLSIVLATLLVFLIYITRFPVSHIVLPPPETAGDELGRPVGGEVAGVRRGSAYGLLQTEDTVDCTLVINEDS
jgi:manganese transport protein